MFSLVLLLAGPRLLGDEAGNSQSLGLSLGASGAQGFTLGSSVFLLPPGSPPLGVVEPAGGATDPLQPPPPVSIGLRNEEKPLSTKFLRGEAIIGGVELASLGILLVLPRSATKWSEHPLEDAGAHLKIAWSQGPVWDHDEWYHNYLGHPWAGALYYNMLRSTRTERLVG